MRVALVSAEFAGVLNAGGIGTYMRNLADMLLARGHNVEIFTSGVTGSQLFTNGLQVHSVECQQRGSFSAQIVATFLDRHAAAPFDVIEGAEFLAETAAIVRARPDIPLVLKLHTPSSLVSVINSKFLSTRAKARFMLAGLARGRLPKPFWTYDKNRDFELDNLTTASVITSPCQAMVDALTPMWGVTVDTVTVLPNVFVPPPFLLETPAETKTDTVTYIGRLELRKGVIALARAIPRVVDKIPSIKFRFVGRSLPYSGRGIDMKHYLQTLLKGYEKNVEFVDGLPHHQVLKCYAQTDICVFPSVWENFPNVCLEAMSAARGVVGSSAGGMAEMLSGGCGLLASPDRPREIAESILTLVRDPERRIRLGIRARQKVLDCYSWDAIGPLQEAAYSLAIATKSAEGKDLSHLR
jgi:glycogen(starch) synthase